MIAAMESSAARDRKLSAAFDPRRPIQRDPFNEIFVLVLSAASAAVVVPGVLLLVGVFAGRLDLLPFVGISVVAELVLIFGVGRPQMKPHERLGWALLWGFTAAVLGAAFWALVYDAAIS
jgi:hypothetical protein